MVRKGSGDLDRKYSALFLSDEYEDGAPHWQLDGKEVSRENSEHNHRDCLYLRLLHLAIG